MMLSIASSLILSCEVCTNTGVKLQFSSTSKSKKIRPFYLGFLFMPDTRTFGSTKANSELDKLSRLNEKSSSELISMQKANGFVATALHN
ncbi:hypothetical protein C5167_010429 [Papaver somniferum]|uniref:Uncharacterized protein n=1 Tax=Papaver somniferum TaxID=3469 RepID=A0A4Y7K080_PAPSO|nr:hypothetical protein C5167_010429 [Papaver somniferum]